MILARLMLSGSLALGSAEASQTSSERVELHISVKTFDGQPLGDVVVCAFVDGEAVADGKTDSEGNATIPVSLEESTVWIEHTSAPPSVSSLIPAERVELGKRLWSLFESYHFERRHQVILEKGRTEYDVLITARAKVDVTAVIVNENGAPQRGDLRGPPLSISGLGRSGVPVKLRSIRKDADSLLLATSYESWPVVVIKPIELSAEQTKQDVDLGRVAIDTSMEGVPIDLTLTGEPEIRSNRLATPMPGVVLVSADGERALSYRGYAVTPGDYSVMKLSFKTDEPLRLPPGKYYVAPGEFINSDAQRDVFSIVRSGPPEARDQLTAIIVHEREGLQTTIDLFEAHQAIRKAIVRASSRDAEAAEK